MITNGELAELLYSIEQAGDQIRALAYYTMKDYRFPKDNAERRALEDMLRDMSGQIAAMKDGVQEIKGRMQKDEVTRSETYEPVYHPSKTARRRARKQAVVVEGESATEPALSPIVEETKPKPKRVRVKSKKEDGKLSLDIEEVDDEKEDDYREPKRKERKEAKKVKQKPKPKSKPKKRKAKPKPKRKPKPKPKTRTKAGKRKRSNPVKAKTKGKRGRPPAKKAASTARRGRPPGVKQGGRGRGRGRGRTGKHESKSGDKGSRPERRLTEW